MAKKEPVPVKAAPPPRPAHFPDKRSVPLPYVVGDSYATPDGRVCKLVAENDWQWVK